ncbi:MAG: hypothetical protein FWC83_00335 [Alphaproteobacteria bacterium]|nr:hypothetical protein [Alphaproteobacteria bacterium]
MNTNTITQELQKIKKPKNKKKIIAWAVGGTLFVSYMLYATLGFRAGEPQKIMGGDFDTFANKIRLAGQIENLEHRYQNLSRTVVIIFAEEERRQLLLSGVSPENIMTFVEYRELEASLDAELRAMRGQLTYEEERLNRIKEASGKNFFARSSN